VVVVVVVVGVIVGLVGWSKGSQRQRGKRGRGSRGSRGREEKSKTEQLCVRCNGCLACLLTCLPWSLLNAQIADVLPPVRTTLLLVPLFWPASEKSVGHLAHHDNDGDPPHDTTYTTRRLGCPSPPDCLRPPRRANHKLSAIIPSQP
jgi:hypothetical protein